MNREILHSLVDIVDEREIEKGELFSHEEVWA